MSFYAQHSTVTFKWVIAPNASPPVKADFDITLILPNGNAAYTDDQLTTYIAPTATAQGEATFNVLLNFLGLYQVTLSIGNDAAHILTGHREIYSIVPPDTVLNGTPPCLTQGPDVIPICIHTLLADSVESASEVSTPTASDAVILSFVEVSRIEGTDWDAISGGPTEATLGNFRHAIIDASGTRLYVVGTNSTQIYQYSLPTPNSLAGISFVGTSGVLSEMTNIRHLGLSDDGLHMLIDSNTSRELFHFSMSPAFDITSLTDEDETLDHTSGFGSWTGFMESFYMKGDGTSWWIARSNDDTLYQFDMSVAYDPSTSSLVASEDISDSVSAPPIDVDPYVYSGGDGIGTGDSWGLSFSDSGQFFHIGVWFSGSGATGGDPPEMVYTYELDTAYDIEGGKTLQLPTPIIQEFLEGDSMEAINVQNYAVDGINIACGGFMTAVVAFKFSVDPPVYEG